LPLIVPIPSVSEVKSWCSVVPAGEVDRERRRDDPSAEYIVPQQFVVFLLEGAGSSRRTRPTPRGVCPMAKESRDQRRKKKLAEERRKERQNKSSAYLGEKYKTDELIPTWMHTEIGIYQTFIITERKLLDQTVENGLERLIDMMKAGPLPPLSETEVMDYEVGREEDLLIESIRRSWAAHFATERQPSKDDIIGILRTIPGSIQKVKAPGPRSQSYMHHIEGFLTRKLGVSVKAVTADRKPLPEPAESELVRLGRLWVTDGDTEARTAFLERATHLMKSGETSRVIDECHLVLGEVDDPASPVVLELAAFIKKARETLVAEMG
jgi:hypothetical protein